MGKILGLGGVFIKANNPKELAAWYQEKLGINFNGQTYVDFPLTGNGSNVLNFAKSDTSYFNPSDKQAMLNLRVEGLRDLLDELKTKGVTIVGDMLDESYGKFGWILDPEGNKIELWEP